MAAEYLKSKHKLIKASRLQQEYELRIPSQVNGIMGKGVIRVHGVRTPQILTLSTYMWTPHNLVSVSNTFAFTV